MKDSKTNGLRLRKTQCSQILKNRGLLSNIHILLPFRFLLLLLVEAPLYVTTVGTKVVTVLGTRSLDRSLSANDLESENNSNNNPRWHLALAMHRSCAEPFMYINSFNPVNAREKVLPSFQFTDGQTKAQRG